MRLVCPMPPRNKAPTIPAFICYGCSGIGDYRPGHVVADLDGPAYLAYYHPLCAEIAMERGGLDAVHSVEATGLA